MKKRFILLVALLSHAATSCSPRSEPPAQEVIAAPNKTYQDLIVGKWLNKGKCLVSQMEFRADGTVLYDLGKPEPLKGTWRFAQEDVLELTPQPLFVYPTPLPVGLIHVTFENNFLVITRNGPTEEAKVQDWFERMQ